MVGDDDQSIYSWRGADIRNILEFERDYPDAKVIRLEQNYRSTQSILDVANAVVTHNRKRKGKNLWTPRGQGALVQVVEVNDERAEAQFVASEVQKLLEGEAGADRAFRPDEIAVLYRTNAQSRVLEEQFGRYAIGYQVIGGPKFYERAEIRDVLAYLTVLVNPATTRSDCCASSTCPSAASAPPACSACRRTPPASARASGKRCARRTRCRVSAPAPCVACWTSCASSRACRPASPGGPPPRSCAASLDESGYEAALKGQRTLEAEGRLENIEEFIGVAAEYDKRAEEPAWTASCRRSRSTATSTPTPTPASSSR